MARLALQSGEPLKVKKKMSLAQLRPLQKWALFLRLLGAQWVLMIAMSTGKRRNIF